jgi:hypothetical protein
LALVLAWSPSSVNVNMCGEQPRTILQPIVDYAVLMPAPNCAEVPPSSRNMAHRHCYGKACPMVQPNCIFAN